MPACLVTETKQFPEEPNLPSSLVRLLPIEEIIQIRPEDPQTELSLSAVVREPNLDQTLEARLFADNAPFELPPSATVGCPPGLDEALGCQFVPPTPDRDLERVLSFGPFQLLEFGLGGTTGVCMRLDLRVSERFITDKGTDDPTGEGAFFLSELTWYLAIPNEEPNLPVARCP